MRKAHPCLLLATLAVGCSAPPTGAGGAEPTAGRSEAITSATKATAYPEAALISDNQGGQVVAYCSGSVIGPKVVLTAGHCVVHFTDWDILVPYNGNQKVHGSNGTVYDYTGGGGMEDPSQHDLGLVFLDAPVKLQSSDCRE